MFGALSLPANAGVFSVAALVVWFAGRHVVRQADALERRTGAGEALVGMVLLGFITALIVFSAVRVRRYEMAIGDIFGANLFCLALLLVVDVAYDGPPVLNEVGRFSTLAVRMGADSLAVLATYFGGLGLLYTLR